MYECMNASGAWYGSMSWSSSLSLSLIVWNHFPYGVRYERSSRGGSVAPG